MIDSIIFATIIYSILFCCLIVFPLFFHLFCLQEKFQLFKSFESIIPSLGSVLIFLNAFVIKRYPPKIFVEQLDLLNLSLYYFSFLPGFFQKKLSKSYLFYLSYFNRSDHGNFFSPLQCFKFI